MGSVYDTVRGVVRMLLERMSQILQGVPPGTIQVTGVLGLAALALGLYQLRGNRGNRPTSDGNSQPRPIPGAEDRREVSRDVTACETQASSSAYATNRSQKSQGLYDQLSSLSKAVRNQLAGIRKITISVPEVLLQPCSAAELSEGALPISEAVQIVKEMCSVCEVYLICHVVDDVGQAVVSGCLEAEGLLGKEPGQLKPHRLLCCSTLEGKNSIVRQIEPDLHIDGSTQTVEDLKRFIPQLLHIRQPNSPAAAPGSNNVGSATSLQQFFGQTS